MGHDSEVGLVLPLLVLVDLTNVVVADKGGKDLGELHLGNVLSGTRVVACTELKSRKGGKGEPWSVSSFFFLSLIEK